MYLTDEEKFRRRMMVSIIAFNVAVISVMVLFTSLRGGMHLMHFFDFVVALLLAGYAIACRRGEV